MLVSFHSILSIDLANILTTLSRLSPFFHLWLSKQGAQGASFSAELAGSCMRRAFTVAALAVRSPSSTMTMFEKLAAPSGVESICPLLAPVATEENNVEVATLGQKLAPLPNPE